MKVYEFGQGRPQTLLFFPCTAEPWWVFKEPAELLAEEFHVFLIIAGGHDEAGSEFVSIEKNTEEAIAYLRARGIRRIEIAYGISMGGSCVLSLLASGTIPVQKAVIDAGITPYPYPRWICRLIALIDFLAVFSLCKSSCLMKWAMPPRKWTPEGCDPKEHYRRIFDFTKNHFSARTIYNVFWSANNYTIPAPPPKIDTEIEYWYGEKEKRARKDDLACTQKTFPQTVPKEFPGLQHAELVLRFPRRLCREIFRFYLGETSVPPPPK